MKKAKQRRRLRITTRRAFLNRAGLTAMGLLATLGEPSRLRLAGAPQLVSSNRGTRAKARPDLLDPNSPEGIEVIQLTTETDVPSSHVSVQHFV